MKIDKEEEINLQRGNVRHLKAELNEIEQKLRDAQTKLKDAQQARAQHKKEGRILELDQNNAERAVERLQEELEAATPQTGVLDQLRDQLKAAQEEADINLTTFSAATAKKDDLHESQRPLKARIDTVQGEINEVKARVQKAKTRAQKLEVKRHEVLLKKNEAIHVVEDAKEAKTAYEQQLEEQQNVVATYINEATKVSARVGIDEGMTCDSLEALLDELLKQKERARRE